MLDLCEDVLALAAALDRQHIDYAFAGDAAKIVWDVPRATTLLHVLIEPTSHAAARAATCNVGATELALVDAVGDLHAAWCSRVRVAVATGAVSVISRDAWLNTSSQLRVVAEIQAEEPVRLDAAAVTTRFRRATQITRLCLSLAKARPLPPPPAQPPKR